MAFAAVASLTSFGSVWDEALIAWRAPHDANGDGLFTADEFVNAVYPAEDADHQGASLLTIQPSATAVGNDIPVVEDDVVSPWNGKTNRLACLSFAQEGHAQRYFSFNVTKTPLTANTSTLTVHLRCKWDGDFVSGSRAHLFSYGNTWNQYRGTAMSFIAGATPGTGYIRFDNGRHQVPKSDWTITPGRWYDIIVTIQDSKAGSSDDRGVVMHCYVFGAYGECVDHALSGWEVWLTPAGGDYQSAELRCQENESLQLMSDFKGRLAQFGIWNRVLTKSEMYEVCSGVSVEPNLVSLGREDGSNAEFIDPSLAETSFVQPCRLDKVPKELNADFPEFTVRFKEKGFGACTTDYDTIAYYDTMARVFSIRTVPGSGTCAVEAVLDEGEETEHVFHMPPLAGGESWIAYLKKEKISRGDHTLTIRRKSGTVKLDFVKLGTTWCLGRNAEWFSGWNNGNQYSGDATTYPMVADMPSKMSGGFSASGTENDDANATVKFDMTKDEAALAYLYKFTVGQTSGNVAVNAILYVNGQEIARPTVSPMKSKSVTIPAGSFRAGENRIALRYDKSKQPNFWAKMISNSLWVLNEGFPNLGMTLLMK